MNMLSVFAHSHGYEVPAPDIRACKVVEANTTGSDEIARLMPCDESQGPKGLDRVDGRK